MLKLLSLNQEHGSCSKSVQRRDRTSRTEISHFLKNPDSYLQAHICIIYTILSYFSDLLAHVCIFCPILYYSSDLLAHVCIFYPILSYSL